MLTSIVALLDRSFTAAILHEYEFTMIFFPVHYAEKDWVTRCKALKNKENLSLQIKAGVSFGVPRDIVTTFEIKHCLCQRLMPE